MPATLTGFAAAALLAVVGILIGIGLAKWAPGDDDARVPGLAASPSGEASPEPAPTAGQATEPMPLATDGEPPPAPSESATTGGPAVKLHRVVALDDGDSFDVVDAAGALFTVRMAQVDAPELSDCFGGEAKAWLANRILDRDVVLEPTTDGPDADQYGRKVREVWQDDLSMNVEIVRAGYATHFASFASEDPDLAVRIAAAEDEARAAGRGLWSACQASANGAAVGHTGRTDGGWACHAAYRECLPAHISDLDCSEIGHQVVLLGDEDPWRLDGNNTHRTNGLGCERYEPWSDDETYPYY